jgi:hypothetical protein
VSTFSLIVAQAIATTAGETTVATPTAPMASTNVAAPTTRTTSTASQDTTNSSLSPGVIAGIAVGSIVGIVGLMVIWLLLRKQIIGNTNRPSNKSTVVNPQIEPEPTYEDPPIEMQPPRAEFTADATGLAPLSSGPRSVHSGRMSPRPGTIFSSTSPDVRGPIPLLVARSEP